MTAPESEKPNADPAEAPAGVAKRGRILVSYTRRARARSAQRERKEHAPMKKFTALAAVLLAILLCAAALAEEIDISTLTLEELTALRARVDARIGEIRAEQGPALPELDVARYMQVQRGSHGAEVYNLQMRLAALGYMAETDGMDGDFGPITETALAAFQRAAGLEATGVADSYTQALLYTDAAPAASSASELDYRSMSRTPDLYKGEQVSFSGRVLQVLEEDSYADTLGVYTILRVATAGSYDDVVCVNWWRDSAAARVLEGDAVSVEGVFDGLTTYEATTGTSVTLPQVTAQTVTVSAAN